MNTQAATLVADAVLAIEDKQERERMSLDIAAHAATMLILLAGPERAAELMYRVADEAVKRHR